MKAKTKLLSIKHIVNIILPGRLSLWLGEIVKRLPGWLFRFNRAFILRIRTDSFDLPKSISPTINVKIATPGDIGDIVRVSGWDEERVVKLLNSGCVCFLASQGNSAPSSLTWLSFGRCYVRGMGFEYNFPPGSSYGGGSFTLPEDRGKGLYLGLNVAIVDYTRELVKEKLGFELETEIQFVGDWD